MSVANLKKDGDSIWRGSAMQDGKSVQVAIDSDKILTVHSVRATKVLLDMIEKHLPAARGRVVLHWSTGTVSEIRGLEMQRRCHCQSIGAGSGALPGQSVRLPRPAAQHALDFGRLAPVLRLCVGRWVDAAALIALASYLEVVRPPPTAPMVLENGHSDFLTVMPMASRSAIAASWTVDR